MWGVRLRRGPDRGGRGVPSTSRAGWLCLGSLGTGQRPVGLGGPGTSASLDRPAMVPRALEDPRRAVARQGFGAPLGSKHRASEFSVVSVSSQIGVKAGEVCSQPAYPSGNIICPSAFPFPISHASQGWLAPRGLPWASLVGPYSPREWPRLVGGSGTAVARACTSGVCGLVRRARTSTRRPGLRELWTKNTIPAPMERGASKGMGRKARLASRSATHFGSCVQLLVWRSTPKLRGADLTPEESQWPGKVFREEAADPRDWEDSRAQPRGFPVLFPLLLEPRPR